MRPRLRAKNICDTCRYRRVKCDEGKPTCASCARSKLNCTWSSIGLQSQRSKAFLVPVDVIPAIRRPYKSEDIAVLRYMGPRQMEVSRSHQSGSPLYHTQQLPVCQFRNDMESAVLHRIPSILAASLAPSPGSFYYDTTAIMQMAFSEPLVRDSLVACYSHLIAYESPHLLPDRAALNRALGTVRQMLKRPIFDQSKMFTLQVSVLLLGLLETAGPDLSGDLSLHWKAGAALAGKFRDAFDESVLCIPEDLYILVLESIFYEACVCMFTKNRTAMVGLWTYCSAYQTLMKINPPGNQQIERSPLIAGPYEIFEMVFHVMILFQKPGLTMMDQIQLNTFEQEVLRIKSDLQEIFRLGPNMDKQKQRRRIDLFDLFCTSLLICIYDLRPPTMQNSQRIPILMKEGFDVFLQMNIVSENNAALMWPVQILGCAIDDDNIFNVFFEKFDAIKQLVDPGHSRRAESLWKRIHEVRTSKPTEVEEQLRLAHGCSKSSRPMLLLRQTGGVLSDEF